VPRLLFSLLAIDVVAVCLYITVLTRLDRYRADKRSAEKVVLFYFLGLLCLVPMLLLYHIGYALSYGLWTGVELVDAWIEDFFLVGPIEEFSKFIVFFVFALRLKSIKEPLDGMLQAAAVALAYASVENLLYGADYGVEVMLVRSVLAIVGHMIYSSIWGFAASVSIYGRSVRGGRIAYGRIFYSLIPAAFVHGLYNYLLDLNRFWLATALDLLVLVAAVVIYKAMAEDSPYKKHPVAEYRKAIHRIRHGLALNPKSYLLNRRMALYMVYAGRYAAALVHFKRCVRIRPLDRGMKSFKAFAYMLTGDVEKGRRNLREACARIGPKGRANLERMVRRFVSDPDARERLLAELRLCDMHGRHYGRPRVFRTPKRRPHRGPVNVVKVTRYRHANRAGKSYSSILREKSEELRALVSRLN
jgi:RsiW-degrading membrane proteinase PrsW (M82 family)